MGELSNFELELVHLIGLALLGSIGWSIRTSMQLAKLETRVENHEGDIHDIKSILKELHDCVHRIDKETVRIGERLGLSKEFKGE